MNRNMTRTLLAGICLASATMTTQARDFEQSNYVPLLLGYHFFDKERNLENDPSLAFGVGREFNKHFAAEFLFGGADLEKDPDDGTDINSRFYRLDFLYHLKPEIWRPYLIAGVGNFELDSKGRQFDETQYNFGVGMKHQISDWADLRVDARGFYGEKTEEKDTALTLGLNVLFAGLATKPQDSDGDGIFDDSDQCPDTPYGVEVDSTGCEVRKDSDGDGVMDDEDQCPDTRAGAEVDAKGCEIVVNNDLDEDGVVNDKDACPDTPKGAKVDETGCNLRLTEVVNIRLAVNFAHDSAEIPDLEMVEVEKLARFLTEYPDSKVVVEGHSDSTGASAYNKELSQRRADSVKQAVTDRYGIDPGRVTAIGYGEERPIADNGTDTGRQMNRRVVGVVEAIVEKDAE